MFNQRFNTLISLLVILIALIACGQGQATDRIADRIATRRGDTGNAIAPTQAPGNVQSPVVAPTLDTELGSPPTPTSIPEVNPTPAAPSSGSGTAVTVAGAPEACGSTFAPGPIAEGYGADGPYGVTVQTIPHPAWDGHEVTIFYPSGLEGQAVPVIFFAHGFAAISPTWYAGFANHVASRGYAFVFSPYPILGRDFGVKYDQIWAGFQAAVEQTKQPFDLSRVGFAGHSFGGGAVPALAYRGLVEQGWGKSGALLYLLAPWYLLDISQAQLQQLPANTKVHMQVYGDDLTNDPRIAIDIYKSIQVPASEKDYVVINSATFGDCFLEANHLAAGSAPGMTNSLDYYGVYRLFDGLADYTFNGNDIGRRVALGHGDPLQTDMGVWPETNAPLADLTSEYANPQPNRPESDYSNPFDGPANPRD